MPDPATRLRRLTEIAQKVLALDPASGDFWQRFAALKRSAEFALAGRRLSRAELLIRARERAIEKRQLRANEMAKRIKPIIKQLRLSGVTSYSDLAKALDEMGVRPPRASNWNRRSVKLIEQRS